MRSDLSPAGIFARVLAIFLLFAVSCTGGSSGCGGGGCGGCGDGSYQYPNQDPTRPDAIIQNETVRVRITQDFLDFIRPQLPELIRVALGGGAGITVDADNVLHVPLPDVDLFDVGVAEARLREGEALIWLDDLENQMTLQFEEPNNVRLSLQNLRLGIRLDLKEDVLGTTSSCPVEGGIGPFGPGPLRHAAEISIDTVIDPGVGASPDYNLDIQVAVNDVELNDLDIDVLGSSAYCAEPECQDCLLEPFGTCLDPGGRCAECHIFCGGITSGLASLITNLIDLLRPLINGLIQPIVEDFVQDALNGINGSSAKVETQFGLADFIGLNAFRATNPVGVLITPETGRFPVIDRGTGLGMEITVDGGAEGLLADCIDPALDPFVPNRGPAPILGGTDMQNRPYHLGATMASSYLNQILYALHRSGSLCIKLGSQDIRDLTGGAFTLNASLLSLLASDLSKLADDTAPVYLELKPRVPATMELGSGELIGQDAMGNDVYDWLLKLSLQDLGIAFHVLIHDRYVRVFEVTTDIFVGLNVTVLPDNSLEIAVGELRIDDFEEEFNELLPNANFAEVLPTLLDLALGAFLSEALVFDVDITNAVSDALGGAPLYLRVNELFRDGAQQDYLTLSMTFTSSRTTNLSLVADTFAELHPKENGLVERINGRMLPTGRVRLAVGDGYDDPSHPLEYQLRVDNGLWRAAVRARPDGTIFVNDPHLKMPGHHMIEVRARYADNYMTMDPIPARIPATVDPFPPSVSAQWGDEGLDVFAQDRLTDDGRTLQIFARMSNDWFELPVEADAARKDLATAWLTFSEMGAEEQVEFRARDLSGNYSEIVKMRLGLSEEADPSANADEAGCACSETPGPRHGGLWALIGLFGLFVLRRRQ